MKFVHDLCTKDDEQSHVNEWMDRKGDDVRYRIEDEVNGIDGDEEDVRMDPILNQSFFFFFLSQD